MNKLWILAPILALLAACGRDQVETYEVAKEKTAAPAQQEMKAPEMRAAAPASNGFSADVPETWTEKPGSGMRIVSYSIEGTSVDFYLISLSMGDVPSNVNRWRGQIGLAPASAEDIAKDLQTFKADGHEVNYAELYNPDSGKGIIAAIVDLAPKYWYFTAKGSVEELQAHAADIRNFLESLKLNH
ncbi:hypothetical protein PDESU_05328 [Pontiella desulfatans]|uniref:PsbP C-terminal domain-containing protein n=1 Tax=Pontiella desulfatans TaxID=2750659 RepID=A0A6C2UAL7_PONDE|nr:hypothetical protein [Pontiella desulfatans]VGO16737.1 hypothetical protein PDESU_05328 [Pontiella desulfatans]